MYKWCQSLSHVRLFVNPWTVGHQASLSMEFQGKNTRVGCHALLQGIFPIQGLNLHLLHWQALLTSLFCLLPQPLSALSYTLHLLRVFSFSIPSHYCGGWGLGLISSQLFLGLDLHAFSLTSLYFVFVQFGPPDTKFIFSATFLFTELFCEMYFTRNCNPLRFL